MRTLVFLCLLHTLNTNAQYEAYFQSAYEQYPQVPAGILEAVAYTNTHIRNITQGDQPSCSGMPLPFGVMGLFDNGGGYFIENGKIVAELSGIPVAVQQNSVEQQILAYAQAFNSLMQLESPQNPVSHSVYSVLDQLTEIPDSGSVNLFARDVQIYSVLHFMTEAVKGQQYGFNPYHFDLSEVFGETNLKVLSAKRISISQSGIHSDKNEAYQLSSLKSTQYGPAIWNPAPSCNFSSRSGTPVSAITIHTIQGTYAGAISWSQNCSSSVSYHYVIRSNDGQITQMVDETDKAWHVGSENPYTIGYEHEGYVTDPSWYTEAMYINSADLSRDIVNSGYGIPPLRTYYGASSAVVQVLGGCTKIKGHQHYPNQTHTDPGINWDWEKYYRLINNNPSITTITGLTGNLYDSGGASGNYTDDERLLWLISPQDAQTISLNFSAFSVESGYDNLFIYDGATIDAPLIGTYTGTVSPGTINSTGGSLLLEFRSDCGTVGSGWAAAYSTTLLDMLPPTTVIDPAAGWITTDFSTAITDVDAQSGIEERFYLAADRNGSQNGWKANGANGAVHEDFEDDQLSWTNQTGSFTIVNGKFSFTDAGQTNSNAYASLSQNGGISYLYQWKQNISSTGTNQRAGLHFFCSDPTLPNRGNSYFVYFRQGQNKAQIYSVDNDVFTLQTNDTCVVNQNTEYTYSVWYTPQTGWIKVYANGELVTSWQDPTPLTTGNSVSFRSGGCEVLFDDLKVFKSRTGTIDIALQSDFRYQSIASAHAGKVTSVTVDGMDNWSAEDEELYFVDWTSPSVLSVADGNTADIDTTYLSTLSGNWTAEDPHSGISEYEYAIGTTLGGSDILSWTSSNMNNSMDHVLLNPVYDQLYYVSVRAHNNAGLNSELCSDGQRLVEEPSAAVRAEILGGITMYPNPANDQVTIEGVNLELSVQIFDLSGKHILDTKLTESTVLDLSNLASGNYTVVLRSGDQFMMKKLQIVR